MDKDKAQLFNHNVAPTEKKDLAQVHPDRVRELLKLLELQASMDNDRLP